MQAYFILSPWVLLWVFSVFHLLFVLWVKSPTWWFCFSSADRWLPNSETFCDFPVNIVIINTMTCFYKHLLCFISLSKIQFKYSWRSSTMFCWYCYNGFSFLFHWIDTFLPNDNTKVFKYCVRYFCLSHFWECFGQQMGALAVLNINNFAHNS